MWGSRPFSIHMATSRWRVNQVRASTTHPSRTWPSPQCRAPSFGVPTWRTHLFGTSSSSSIAVTTSTSYCAWATTQVDNLYCLYFLSNYSTSIYSVSQKFTFHVNNLLQNTDDGPKIPHHQEKPEKVDADSGLNFKGLASNFFIYFSTISRKSQPFLHNFSLWFPSKKFM